MSKTHQYTLELKWTGNKGEGTRTYSSYERSHNISAENKVVIEGSSDPSFRGDKTKYNPEELFLSSISSCHMLWFLNLCAEAGIVITEYVDQPVGIMEEEKSGNGKFTKVNLFPKVRIEGEYHVDTIKSLHHKAHEMCFIANSCNFPIEVNDEVITE